MGKSELRKVAREAFAGAFEDCEDLSPEELARRHPVVVRDSVVALRAVGRALARDSLAGGEAAADVTTRALALRCLRGVVADATRSRLVVALFDKSSAVVLAKQPEQRERDGRVASAASASQAARARELLELARAWLRADDDGGDGDEGGEVLAQRALPAGDWARLIEDREGRQEAIRLVCRCAARSALAPELRATRPVHPDAAIWLDYEEADGRPHRSTVVAAESASGAGALSTPPSAQGEFDVGFLHYAHDAQVARLLGPAGSVLVNSVDTDVLVVAALGARNGASPLRWLAGDEPGRLREVVHVPAFAATLELTVPESADGVGDLARAFCLAGNDFCVGIPGVGCGTLLRAWLAAGGRESPAQVAARLRSKARPDRARKRRRCAGPAPAEPDPEHEGARAEWALNYWRHSVHQPHSLLATCLGSGWSLDGARVVRSEELAGAGAPTTRA